MIEYTKLFILLKELGMKKTDLLEIMSPQTLAKLGKGATVQTDIIDKICLFLNAQPSDIMEVYKYKEVDGEQYKVKTKSIFENEFEYHMSKNGNRGITISELGKLLNDDGNIDMIKFRELLESIEE